MATEIRRWKIGDVQISRLIEVGPVDLPPVALFPDATREQVCGVAWLHPHFATPDGQIKLNFQCFLIEVGGRKILVHTCVGEHKRLAADILSHLVTGFLDTLKAAGAGPDDIDAVLCTHLHFDHVGWNTRLVDGEWRPTFPKARYLFGREEIAFALTNPAHEGDESLAESIKPILDAGLADPVESDHRLCDEIRLIPTPGHTPGHVSVWISSKGEEAIITGDAVHHPLQIAHPEIVSSFCHEPARGVETRRLLFNRLADEPFLVIGTHFTGPTAGFVVRDGETWRLNLDEAER